MLGKLEFIEKAVVVVEFDDDEKANKIIAFVKEKEECMKSYKEIKEKLKNYLPDYMIPVIRIVERFPLNVNGKIDERKLLEMGR